MAGPAIEAKGGLMAISVSSPDRRDWLLTLQRCLPHSLLDPIADRRPSIDTGCPTSGGQFRSLVDTIVGGGDADLKTGCPDAYSSPD